jgi:uncharacterized protein YbjT (DUF2867 family)
MYVVAGVTGHTGGVVAETLLAQGKPVTVIVRTEEKGQPWASRGAHVAVASLDDTHALSGILRGAEGAYLLIPPNPSAPDLIETPRRLAQALAQAVNESGVPHIAFLSSIGAQHASGTGPIITLHNAEQILQSVGNVTLVRAAYFLENWIPVLPVARANGVLPSLLTRGRKIPMVATKDIARVAAESLLNPAHGRRIIELAGPQEYGAEDIAAFLSSLLGRDVQVQGIPISAAVDTFMSFGLPEQMALLLREMYAGLNSGLVDFERQGTGFRRGTVTAEEALRGMLGKSVQMQAGA